MDMGWKTWTLDLLIYFSRPVLPIFYRDFTEPTVHPRFCPVKYLFLHLFRISSFKVISYDIPMFSYELDSNDPPLLVQIAMWQFNTEMENHHF